MGTKAELEHEIVLTKLTIKRRESNIAEQAALLKEAKERLGRLEAER